jgi:hypothetical protein
MPYTIPKALNEEWSAGQKPEHFTKALTAQHEAKLAQEKYLTMLSVFIGTSFSLIVALVPWTIPRMVGAVVVFAFSAGLTVREYGRRNRAAVHAHKLNEDWKFNTQGQAVFVDLEAKKQPVSDGEIPATTAG